MLGEAEIAKPGGLTVVSEEDIFRLRIEGPGGGRVVAREGREERALQGLF